MGEIEGNILSFAQFSSEELEAELSPISTITASRRREAPDG